MRKLSIQSTRRTLVKKKVYSSPSLRNLGTLRDLTLGPSYGGGESGHPRTFIRQY